LALADSGTYKALVCLYLFYCLNVCWSMCVFICMTHLFRNSKLFCEFSFSKQLCFIWEAWNRLTFITAWIRLNCVVLL
jgi:hypothetical protein